MTTLGGITIGLAFGLTISGYLLAGSALFVLGALAIRCRS